MLIAVLDTDSLVEHLIASAAAGGFLFVAWFVYPRGMGLGDVKLAFVLGIYLGQRRRARDVRRLHRRRASSAAS